MEVEIINKKLCNQIAKLSLQKARAPLECFLIKNCSRSGHLGSWLWKGDQRAWELRGSIRSGPCRGSGENWLGQRKMLNCGTLTTKAWVSQVGGSSGAGLSQQRYHKLVQGGQAFIPSCWSVFGSCYPWEGAYTCVKWLSSDRGWELLAVNIPRSWENEGGEEVITWKYIKMYINIICNTVI